MKKFTALLLALVMILPLGVSSYANDENQLQNSEVGSYADDTEQPQNPYVEAYLKSLESESYAAVEGAETDFDAAIQSLNGYYAKDCTLAESVCEFIDIDVSLITSVEKEDKIQAMYALIDVYDSLDAECQKLVYGYFTRYANDSEDARAIEFCNELREEVKARNRALTAKAQHSISTQSDDFNGR